MDIPRRLFLLIALLLLPLSVRAQAVAGASLPTVWRLDELLYGQVCVVSPAGPRADTQWQGIPGRGREFRLDVTTSRERVKRSFGKARFADVIHVAASLTGTDKEGAVSEASQPETSGDGIKIVHQGMPLKIEAGKEYLACEVFGDDENHALYHIYIRFLREKPAAASAP